MYLMYSSSLVTFMLFANLLYSVFSLSYSGSERRYILSSGRTWCACLKLCGCSPVLHSRLASFRTKLSELSPFYCFSSASTRSFHVDGQPSSPSRLSSVLDPLSPRPSLHEVEPVETPSFWNEVFLRQSASALL